MLVHVELISSQMNLRDLVSMERLDSKCFPKGVSLHNGHFDVPAIKKLLFLLDNVLR